MKKMIRKNIIFGLYIVILLMSVGCSKTVSTNKEPNSTPQPTVVDTASEPMEAKLTVEEMLSKIETCIINYTLYNFPSYYYDNLLIQLKKITGFAFSEFLNCEDYAIVTLSSYKKADLYDYKRHKNQSDEDWNSYRMEARQCDQAIGFDEILLANDDTFDILSDKEKIEVLNEVKEKLECRTSGNYFGSNVSPFLIYVQEQNRDGKSKWFNYIMNSSEDDTVLKEILGGEILSWGGNFNY